MLDSIFNSSITYSQFLNSNQVQENTHSSKQLDFFRQPDQEAFHLLFSVKKKHAATYRLIFLGFSCLFFLLGLLVYFKTANWKCEFYFSNCQLIKTFTYLICLFLSAGSCSLSFLIRPEKDTVKVLTHTAKKQLSVLYRSAQDILKRSSTGSEKLIFSCHTLYGKTQHFIQESEHQSLQMLDRIFLARQLTWQMKEQLFNQAIFEIESQLKHILETFEMELHHKAHLVLEEKQT